MGDANDLLPSFICNIDQVYDLGKDIHFWGASVVSSLKRGTKPAIATPKATVRLQESGK